MQLQKTWDFRDASRPILAAGFGGKDQIVTLAEWDVQVRNAKNGALILEVPLQYAGKALAVSQDGFAVGSIGLVTFFDFDGKRNMTKKMAKEPVLINYSNQGIACCNTHFEIAIVGSDKLKRRFHHEIRAVVWRPDGEEIIVGFASGKMIRLKASNLETVSKHYISGSMTSIHYLDSGRQVALRLNHQQLALMDFKLSRKVEIACQSTVIVAWHHLILAGSVNGSLAICNTHHWDMPLKASLQLSDTNVDVLATAGDDVIVASKDGHVASGTIQTENYLAFDGVKSAKVLQGTRVLLDDGFLIKCREVVQQVAVRGERVAIKFSNEVMVYKGKAMEFHISFQSSKSGADECLFLLDRSFFLVGENHIWRLDTDEETILPSKITSFDVASPKSMIIGCQDGTAWLLFDQYMQQSRCCHRSKQSIGHVSAQNSFAAVAEEGSSTIDIIDLVTETHSRLHPLTGDPNERITGLTWNSFIDGMLCVSYRKSSYIWYSGIWTRIMEEPVKQLWGHHLRLANGELEQAEYEVLIDALLKQDHPKPAYALCKEDYDLRTIANAMLKRGTNLDIARKCWIRLQDWKRVHWLDQVERLCAGDTDLIKAMDCLYLMEFDRAKIWFEKSTNAGLGVEILDMIRAKASSSRQKGQKASQAKCLSVEHHIVTPKKSLQDEAVDIRSASLIGDGDKAPFCGRQNTEEHAMELLGEEQYGRASRIFQCLGANQVVEYIRSTYLDQCVAESRFYDVAELDPRKRQYYLAYARLFDGCLGAGIWLMCQTVDHLPLGVLSSVLYFKVAQLANQQRRLSVVHMALRQLMRLRYPREWTKWIERKHIQFHTSLPSCDNCHSILGVRPTCLECGNCGLLPKTWCWWSFEELPQDAFHCAQCQKGFDRRLIDECFYCDPVKEQ